MVCYALYPWKRSNLIGPPWLTKYEKARIIGARALQLALGAPPLIDLSKIKTIDPIIIAEEELRRGLLPITIRRRLPDGRVQLIPLSQLLKYRRLE